MLSTCIILNICFSYLTPQAVKTPKETNENKEPAAEVTLGSNGNQNGHGAVEKKKLNKQERKEARRQKNGKTVKIAKESETQETEDSLAGKKKKKDRKRQHSCEEDEKNGAEMTKKKKKTSKFESKRLYTNR